MVRKNYSSAVGFALLLTAVTAVDVQLVRSQTSAFKLPESVPAGTNVRIDGSSSMAAVNTVLKQRFEQQFAGTQVNIAANGTPAGIQAVLAGQADLAAIGRPLTEAEKAQGLKAAQVGRDKIAILVGADNPFAKSLTIDQFAKLFRGEVKNWSEVGGQNASVKFVDRPDSSDTRQAFKEYPVFKEGKFATGATADKLNEDTTQTVVANLGNNGISYATANQTKGLSGAKVVTMHGTKPTDPRYPFSQPLYYIYKDGANPAVQAFLGLATTTTGQTAIEQAGVADAIPATKTATPQIAATQKTDPKAAADKPAGGQIVTGANPQSGNAPGGAQSSPQSSPQSGDSNPLAFLFPGNNTAGTGADSTTGLPNWLWWLLPIGSGAALLWMLGRGRRSRHDRGATGTFNAPGYAEGIDDRETPAYSGASYEGGYDPLHGNGNVSTDVSTHAETPDLDWNRGTTQPSNLDLDPNFADNRSSSSGSLGGAALAGGAAALAGGAAAGAAARSAFSSNRAKQSRVVLKSRSSQEVEAFWDIPAEERQAMRQQGGEKLALRLYDVTDIDLAKQPAHSVQQFDCDELTQRQRLPIALPDRDYLAEIGYLTADNHWLSLARSTHVRVPAASGFSSSVAKAGGAATGAIDSTKSVLSGDRDTEADTAIEQPQPTNVQSPSWFQRVTHHPVTNVAPTEGAVNPVPEAQSPDVQSQGWFQRITHQTGDVATNVPQNVAQTGDSALRSGGNVVAGGAAAGAAAWSFLSGKQDNSRTGTPPNSTSLNEAASFTTTPAPSTANPFGTGVEPDIREGRLVLTPRNARWAYASWDIPRSLRSRINVSPGGHLALRLYDVTDGGTKLPARYEQHDLDETALSCDVPISLPDRTYVAEIGYVDPNYQWTPLARSTPAHIPAN